MNHPKSFFFLTDRSFALNQSPACATSIKVGTSVMKVETFIDSKATWTHQGCTAASMGISFDLPHSSLITCGPLYNRKSRWQVSHESKIWRIQKITLFAPLSSCHFPSNFLCVLSARSATDGPPRNFFAGGKTGPGPTWRRVRVRNWPPRSLWCCLRGDVGLPGTVRGHFKERDLTGFPAHFLGRKLAFSQPRLSHWG